MALGVSASETEESAYIILNFIQVTIQLKNIQQHGLF